MTGGGDAGSCTVTPGILAQFEILNLLNSNIRPTLDAASQTYWFDNQGSLVTFDLQDTWAAKSSFAASSCFGGTFIWSLDQVTTNLVDGSSPGSGGAGGGVFSTIEWNPNPFPSPGAASETFVQKPGTVISTVTSVVARSTVTTTKTVVIPAFTSSTTRFTTVSGTIQSITGSTIVPARTSTATVTITAGSTVTSTTLVTKTATTIVIPVPKASTTVTIEGVPITLNSGGTPVNSPVPTDISQPNAVTPTWTLNIFPPPNATVVTFTAPLTSSPTWTSTVPVPPQSSSSGVVVTGPPGDHSRCNPSINIWNLLFGGRISGCLPVDVGIRGGITPSPIRPPGWTGPWSNPFPLPTGGPPDPDSSPTGTRTDTSSTSSSSTSSSSCPTRTPSYSLPDDPENANWSDLGSDPDTRRRRELRRTIGMNSFGTGRTSNFSTVSKRAGGREAKIPDCGLTITSPQAVNLGAGTYFLVPFSAGGGTSTQLTQVQVGGKPSGPPNFLPTNQEHVFEIGYINQFFTFLAVATGCDWIEHDVVDYTRVDGSNMGVALITAIDNVQNMVWVDKPLNQAKSNIVNGNKASPDDPPQHGSLIDIINFDVSAGDIIEVETFLRNFAALGQYFGQTSTIFRDTATRFQNLLSEVTPRTIPDSTRSLPVIFRDWLMDTIGAYPNGITTRANNAWNLYRGTMQDIARLTNNGQVPTCFPLYTNNIYQPSSFTFMNLIPAAPTTPSCNVPGTQGSIGYVSGSTTVRSIPFDTLPQRIMGAGNTHFYAAGSGSSLTGAHYQGIDASPIGPACRNVFSMQERTPGNGPDANLAFQCNGATGRQTANFNFVVNGQQLGCAGVITGHAGGDITNIFCAVAQGSARDCAAAFAPPGSNIFKVQMRWFPS
ncbi:hypothetical protein HGRIS_006655 [Hohenbuehelia grisea]|uniref:Uncharacterized protein n=1 Tax=Hohenbuehelia grisea TaxID=104357 RepID=A0ABR3JA74_9AGAR